MQNLIPRQGNTDIS